MRRADRLPRAAHVRRGAAAWACTASAPRRTSSPRSRAGRAARCTPSRAPAMSRAGVRARARRASGPAPPMSRRRSRCDAAIMFAPVGRARAARAAGARARRDGGLRGHPHERHPRRSPTACLWEERGCARSPTSPAATARSCSSWRRASGRPHAREHLPAGARRRGARGPARRALQGRRGDRAVVRRARRRVPPRLRARRRGARKPGSSSSRRAPPSGEEAAETDTAVGRPRSRARSPARDRLRRRRGRARRRCGESDRRRARARRPGFPARRRRRGSGPAAVLGARPPAAPARPSAVWSIALPIRLRSAWARRSRSALSVPARQRRRARSAGPRAASSRPTAPRRMRRSSIGSERRNARRGRSWRAAAGRRPAG